MLVGRGPAVVAHGRVVVVVRVVQRTRIPLRRAAATAEISKSNVVRPPGRVASGVGKPIVDARRVMLASAVVEYVLDARMMSVVARGVPQTREQVQATTCVELRAGPVMRLL